MSNRNPKYLNKVMVTKQKLGNHEFTVLYDRQGNKYLKLEKFELDLKPRIPILPESNPPSIADRLVCQILNKTSSISLTQII